jgi:hypothetical protein
MVEAAVETQDVWVRRVHGRYWPEVLPEAGRDLLRGRGPRRMGRA